MLVFSEWLYNNCLSENVQCHFRFIEGCKDTAIIDSRKAVWRLFLVIDSQKTEYGQHMSAYVLIINLWRKSCEGEN